MDFLGRLFNGRAYTTYTRNVRDVAVRDIAYMRTHGQEPLALLVAPDELARMLGEDGLDVDNPCLVGLPVIECDKLNDGAVCVVDAEQYLRLKENVETFKTSRGTRIAPYVGARD